VGGCEYDCAKRAPVHAACPCARLVCRKCAGVASAHPDPSPCFACGRPDAAEFSADQCRPDFGVLAALAGRCSASDTSVPLQHVVCVLFGALLPPVVSTFVSVCMFFFPAACESCRAHPLWEGRALCADCADSAEDGEAPLPATQLCTAEGKCSLRPLCDGHSTLHARRRGHTLVVE
jgi:hypothetical protein